jgi:hypothetical protein
MDDPALVQIARLLGLPRGSLTADRAPDLIAERCEQFAAALIEETAASDDVTDAPSATAYLEDRLRVLDPYIPSPCADSVRSELAKTTAGWSA